jgi:hypothetical protein
VFVDTSARIGTEVLEMGLHRASTGKNSYSGFLFDLRSTLRIKSEVHS